MDYVKLLDNLPSPIAVHRIICDSSGKPIDFQYVYCNQQFAQLLSLSPDEIIGHCVTDILPGTENDPADWIGRYGKIALHGGSEIFEDYSQALDKWFRVQAHQPEEGFFATLAEDISDQNRTAELIAKKQKDYNSLLARARDIVYRFELQSHEHFSYISPSVMDVCGYKDQAFYDDPKFINQLTHPDDREFLKKMLYGSEDESKPFRLRWLHKNGSIIWLEQRNIRRYKDDGSLSAFEGVARDISETVAAEKALEESEMQLSRIISAVSDMVLYYENPEMKIMWANSAIRTIARDQEAQEADQELSPHKLHGRYCYELWGKDPKKPCHNCPVLRCFSSKQEEWGEITTSNGRIVSIHASPIFTPGGKLKGVVETARDITQNIRLEQELQQALEQADAANLVKDQFIANMSHELRTPLNGVIGVVELLIDQVTDPKHRQLLSLIQQSGNRLDGVVQEILAFSQLDPNELRNTPMRFHLPSFLQNICEPIVSLAEEKELDFQLQQDTNLPCWVQSFPGRLRQILRCLADNAIKFTETGSVSIYAKKIKYKQKDAIEFTVADTGVGIAKKFINRIFEPFFQVESGFNRKFDGVGLGLSIAKRMAEECGGCIKITSTEKIGTSAVAILPIEIIFAKKAQKQDNTSGKKAKMKKSNTNSTHAPEQTDSKDTRKKLRVLIVEDNRINQHVAAAIVRTQGHEVETAVNGLEAIECLKKEQFDLVLMDIQMPEMDGIEATQVIRNPESAVLDHDVPIIAVSAFDSNDEQGQCMKAGMNSFLSKPITPIKLAQYIEEFTRA